MYDKDKVKKIFGKSAKEVLSSQPEDHSKYHSPNAFCGNAGPEEMKHYYQLVSKLTGDELASLAVTLGFVSRPTHDPTDSIVRQSFEDIMDEADREDFYREYQKLIDNRSNK
jgi:hypothetical protein